MFWSLGTFEYEAEIEQYPIRDLFKLSSKSHEEEWTCSRTIHQFLHEVPDLKEVVEENVGQIVQVAKLRLKNSSGNGKNQRHLIVGNTHLFYHPLADHVRLLQTFVICKMLDHWCRNENGTRHPLIFCGDLNSDPASGAVQLLLHRKIVPDLCETWKNLESYTWEGGDCYFETEYLEYENNPSHKSADKMRPNGVVQCRQGQPLVKPPTIELPDSFPQLISAYDPFPEFSNYVVGFAETLDYIFVSESQDFPGLRVKTSAPIPTIADMQKYPAIPNEDYPSDHVSLACDFEWEDFRFEN